MTQKTVKKNKSVFVIGGDELVTQMFRDADWDTPVDPHYADFLCFTGGADVSPELYGETNTHSYTNIKRDKREVKLFREFLGKGMIGICRGGQFLNVMSGGKLRQHINGHSMGYQKCRSVVGGRQGPIISLHEDHHQEILPNGKAKVFCRSIKDNVVEGCFYYHTQSLCFQPHPEWGHDDTRSFFFAWLNYFYNFKQ